jgi:hypothetical protein
MFIVWRGYGIWFLFVPFVTLGAAAYVDQQWKGIVDTGLLFVLATALAGVICLGAGIVINRGGPFQVIDRMTGLLVTIRSRHSVYGIPVQYWGLALLLAAGAMMLRQSL